MSLEDLGWTSEREGEFASRRALGLVPARVAREDRGRCLLLDGSGERPGVPAGSLRRAAARGAAWPAVGDWVALRSGGGEGVAVIREVLPRAGAFARKAAGATTTEQVIAANVDVVLLVTG